MRIILRPICWIKTFLRNWDNLNWYLDIAMVSGCDYRELENGDLICEVCGKKE